MQFVDFFAQHPRFSTSYEEMVASDPEKIRALQDLMGVSPRELTTTTRRLGYDNLRQAIANRSQCSHEIAGSRGAAEHFAHRFELLKPTTVYGVMTRRKGVRTCAAMLPHCAPSFMFVQPTGSSL